MQMLEQWKHFSKNSHSDLDLEPRTLEVELEQDIIKRRRSETSDRKSVISTLSKILYQFQIWLWNSIIIYSENIWNSYFWGKAKRWISTL